MFAIWRSFSKQANIDIRKGRNLEIPPGFLMHRWDHDPQKNLENRGNEDRNHGGWTPCWLPSSRKATWRRLAKRDSRCIERRCSWKITILRLKASNIIGQFSIAMFFITISWSYHGHIGHIRVIINCTAITTVVKTGKKNMRRECWVSAVTYQTWLSEWCNTFQVGWNHQPEVFFPPLCCIKTY